MDEQGRREIEALKSSYGENRRIREIPEWAPAIRCHNGTFAGNKLDKISVFKGVPFALPPTGTRRWKRPVEAPRENGIYEAYYNGRSPIQTEWETERASYYPQSEDCLYLNIWTANGYTRKSNRPVIVFLHGGAYGWGGTADPMYDGENLVNAHPEVILVTAGYRTGLMGFVDLSAIPGGEEFPDAPNLGIWDQIEALKWVKKNCRAFGGDPENITVAGESAGAGTVSLLAILDEAKGLFRRVIAESGSVALTFSREECSGFTRRLLEVSGAKSMDDLMALSEYEIRGINEELNLYNNFPMRDGRLIPEDLYTLYGRGRSRNTDMLIGTNANEMNYWIGEVGGIVPYSVLIPVKFENDLRKLDARDKKRVKQFMQDKGKPGQKRWRMTEFYNELMFRLPAMFQAELHARAGGRVYTYYWKIPSKIKYYGACHAVELAYVFGNTDNTIYTGAPADKAVSDMVQQMWVNFAKTGDPSTAEHKWLPYSRKERNTMVISSEFLMKKDVLKEQRLLLMPLIRYKLNPSYTDLKMDVPFVRFAAGIGIALGTGLIVGALFGIRALLKGSRKQ